MRVTLSLVSQLGIVLFCLPAEAIRTPDHFAEEHGLVLKDQKVAARHNRRVSWQTPERGIRAFQAFQEQHGGQWRALWDADTQVPLRIFGSGIEAPGAVENAARAEAVSRALLLSDLSLLSPGSRSDDYVVVTNTESNGVRVVAFAQQHRGFEVLGGQLSFRFKADRLLAIGSEAFPGVQIGDAAAQTSPEVAKTAARDWIATTVDPKAEFESIDGPFVLPIVRRDELRYRLVFRAVVRTNAPVGRFEVFVGADDGKAVARKQTLRFFTGTVHFNTPDRHPGGTRSARPARGLTLDVDNTRVTADDTGTFEWQGADNASAVVDVVSARVRVIDDAGSQWTKTTTIEDQQTLVFDERASNPIDAQLNAYIATENVLARAKQFAPENRWVGSAQIQATVNIAGSCNAFSDGTTINFFAGSRQCANTGQIADVVYHEFGHSLHAQSILRGAGSFDTALSEGVSDFLAADITGDPGTARGFFFNNNALRHIDEPGRERRWPEDVDQDPHITGIIIGGALWDLRKALISKLGEEAGAAKTRNLYYQILQRASDIPSSYVEALVADDDDGDLSNGTPNFCEIVDAFGAHGLAEAKLGTPSVARPEFDGKTIRIRVGGEDACPGATVASAKAQYQIGEKMVVEVDLESDATGFAATLPTTKDELVRYRVEIKFDNGDLRTYPANPADPFYQYFDGSLDEIYCTDFEEDPFANGWSHDLVAGEAVDGADDWQWGMPAGTSGSGDPAGAFSGTYSVGNDLGGGNFNGLYQGDKTNRLMAPEIDVSEFEHVRLQFRRWLTVENGHFDKASVVANGETVWQNLNDGERGETHHVDREWRFHDIDVTTSALDGRMGVAFELQSDQGLHFGGWTIDDFCILGRRQQTTPPTNPGGADPNCTENCGDVAADPLAGGPETLSPADSQGCGCSASEPGDARLLAVLLVGLGLRLRPRRKRSPTA